MFSNYFNVLISKIIFKNLKNIINVHFNTKNYLKNNHNNTYKQTNIMHLDEQKIHLIGKFARWTRSFIHP